MTNEKFLKIFNESVARITRIINYKHYEYATGDEEFLNFINGSQFLKLLHPVAENPAFTAMSYMTKHVVSTYEIVRDFIDGKMTDIDKINEKFCDLHTYLFLIEAMLKEGRETEIDLVAKELKELKLSESELLDNVVIKKTEFDLFNDLSVRRDLYIMTVMEKWENLMPDLEISWEMAFIMENELRYLKSLSESFKKNEELIRMAALLFENPNTQKEIYPITSTNDAYVKFNEKSIKHFRLEPLNFTSTDLPTMRTELYNFINTSKSNVIAVLTPILKFGNSFGCILGELYENDNTFLTIPPRDKFEESVIAEFENYESITIKQQDEV